MRAGPHRATRGGQPLYADMAIELVLTLRLVFHLTLRQAEGFARSVLRLLGLDLSVPDHTTLSRRSRAFAERQPRAARYDEAVHVVLDSTGLQVFGQGEWDAQKHGRTPRQWRKLHLAIDAATGEIVAHVLTDKDVGDIHAVPALLATVEGPIGSVIADGAYDSASVYEATTIRRLTSSSRRAHPRWSTPMTLAPRPFGLVMSSSSRRRTAWQKATGYDRHSLVETTICRYQHIIGSKLRARSSDRQQGEVAIAVQALNRMICIAKPISVCSS